ncbi:MAG: chromosomal replication initiator protein DnaA [Clostridiales bacterium]|nr:chromosomal replication initiator protein DnaA [Clostridiales bacterium]
MRQNAELWEKTLALAKKELSGREYNTWIKGMLSLVRYDRADGVLYLGAESEMQKSQLVFKYEETLEKAVEEVFGSALKLRFLLPDESPPDKVKVRAMDPPGDEIIFNPRYTFENFIIGDNSRFAAGAAQAVAEAPGKAYSPLFIYGDSGLGKTHLMNAIGIHILKNFPRLRVLYVSSETFTEEFVTASIRKEINLFKEKYRGVDVLLIDDIQFISEKEKTIEEVFYTYEALYKSGKQMVFTSDRPPREILGLDERLKGRLSEGLLVDLQPPSYEIKVAILKNKARLDGVPDSEGLMEVIHFIAEIVKSNVRELEGAFNKVVAFAKFAEKDFSKKFAREILFDMVRDGDGPSGKDIKKVVAGYFNISAVQIDSDDRSRALSTPRQVAMYLCRELTDMSFPKIAELFKKDYSTVHHAHKKIGNDIGENEHLRKVVMELTEKIQDEY